MKNRTFQKFKNQMDQSKWHSISKYVILICIAIGFNTNPSFAQSKSSEFSFPAVEEQSSSKKSEFSVSVGGLISSLAYDLKGGNKVNKLGGGFGLRYAYQLNTNWSIGVGVDYQPFASAAILRELIGSYMTTDSENEEFEFRYTANKYREEQSASFVTIPLTIQHETSGSARFYIAGGVKIGLPIKAQFQSSASSLKTSGYYAQYDGELFGPNFAGFGDFGEVKSAKKDLDLKMAYILTLETGVKQLLSNGNSFYVGIYVDYGLNDLYEGEITPGTPVVSYSKNAPSVFAYNNLFEAEEASDLKVFAFGLKIRYAIGF